MRWLTPQELAKLSGKSERTIRHYAAQDQLITKREGKKWVIDPISALKKGFTIPKEELAKLIVLELPSSNVQSKEQNAVPSAKEKKYRKLIDLGVYKDLRNMLNEEASLPEPIREHLKNSMNFVALGFFEFSKPIKVENFRKARQSLVLAAVLADISFSTEVPKWRSFIEDSLISGTIGLIRQSEGFKRKVKPNMQIRTDN